MAKKRIVGGAITKNSTGLTTIEVTGGHFKANAAEKNNWHGEEDGIKEFNYQRKDKEKVEVLQMYYDGKEILETWDTYTYDQLDKKVTGYGTMPDGKGWYKKNPNDPRYTYFPKPDAKPVLTTQLVKGTLHFKDDDIEYCFDANSGYQQNGAIPDGDYTMQNYRKRSEPKFSIDGNNYGFTVDLTPDLDVNTGKPFTDRKSIEAHPTTKLTHGCVGILGLAQQKQFNEMYQKLSNKYKKIKLKAKNINGAKNGTISENGEKLFYGQKPVLQIKK